MEYYLIVRLIPQAATNLSVPGGSYWYNTGGSRGNSRLIMLGQKCFRKNRYTVDSRPAHSLEYEELTVESHQSISAQIAAQNAAILNIEFTFERFDTLHRVLLGEFQCMPMSTDSLKLAVTAATSPFKNNPTALQQWRAWVYQVYVNGIPGVATASNELPAP